MISIPLPWMAVLIANDRLPKKIVDPHRYRAEHKAIEAQPHPVVEERRELDTLGTSSVLAAMTDPQPWYGHPAEPTLVTIGDVGVGQTTGHDTQRLGAGRADDVPVRRPVA